MRRAPKPRPLLNAPTEASPLISRQTVFDVERAEHDAEGAMADLIVS